jgi:hypothetical protein
VKQTYLPKENAMSRLSPSSIAGSAAAILIALATASAFAQTAPAGAAVDPTSVQPAKKPATSMKPLTPSPDSKSLAVRPLPAAAAPPPAPSTKPPAAPPPGGAKKCGERKGDC